MPAQRAPDLTKPLSRSAEVFALAFQPPKSGGVYGAPVAKGILDALRELRFSGRLEVGAMDNPLSGMYVVMLAPMFVKKPKDTFGWWSRLQELLSEQDLDGSKLDVGFSEITDVHTMRAQVPTFAILFADGAPTQIVEGDAESSWFLGEAAARIEAGA